MATASSHPPANLAHTPTLAAGRQSSMSVPTPSESPSIHPHSPSLPAHVGNGAINGYPTSAAAPADGSVGADLRLYPRDGRVRNPVPSKLKNVKDLMKGNFGVMHMDVSSHRASEGRDAAAKRTSESTALQAKLAQTDTYVSHQRRANYPKPPGLKQFSSPGRSSEPPSDPVDSSPRRSLSVADTKAEQARLLTLLRSLPHHTVVDQICKALAFFGGIPDAPPPADGKFPESEEYNGSGSLFVGWIAEIFPDLDRPRRPAQVEPEPTPSQTTTQNQRRPRGRPKGSKATKARSDKGLKKGSQKASKATESQPQDLHDESWVDVEDSVLQINENGNMMEADSTFRNAHSTPSRVFDGESAIATPATGSTGGFRSINDAHAPPGSSVPGPGPVSNPKRRGRPKGSKNRPKDPPGPQQPGQPAAPAKANAPVSNQATVASTASGPPPPKVTPVPVPVTVLDSQPKKKKNTTSKAKAAKSQPVSTNEATTMVTNAHQQAGDLNSALQMQPSQQISATESPYTAGFNSSNRNGVAATDVPSHLSAQNSGGNAQVAPSQIKPAAAPAKKRKRPSANASSVIVPGGGAPVTTQVCSAPPQQVQPNLPHNTPAPQMLGQAAHPVQQTASSLTSAPAAKRPRKSHDPSVATTGKRQTPSSVGQKASVSSASVVAEPSHKPSQVGITPQSQLAAEGLEAHFAAMQSHSDQVQSYGGRAQQSQQQQPTVSMGTTVSPAPASNMAPADGLEAHYERFSALPNFPDNTRQPSTSRQQKQQQQQQQQHQQQQQQQQQHQQQHQANHTVSPLPSQPSKTPQMGLTLTSQQQARAPQNYYSQAQALGSSYTTQPLSYPTNQRAQQHMGTSSPGTALVQHVANSPQFGAQSHSPLMQADSNYRGSPSLIHNPGAYAPRRTTSASPLDTNPYRSASTTSHGVPGHSPHFGTRQPPATTATAVSHSTSHPGLSSTFTPFTDTSFLDMQSLDPGAGHGSLGLGAGSYGLGNGGVPTHQRTSSSNAGSLYSPAAAMSANNYLNSSMGRSSQNRWGTS
ncbi:hypothetical protein GGR56DRAFT_615237 [Xylariaceae sp. FL0804]|nr:hypothetical protein GGR56DRAFT_615237 [Xylariaceae sp. FL0804]